MKKKRLRNTDILELPPYAVTVTVTTTMTIPLLVGNPYEPSFVTVTGWGVDRTDMIWIHLVSFYFLYASWDRNIFLKRGPGLSWAANGGRG